MGSSPKKDIRRGRNRALNELEKSFEGPIRGLQLAPEFFGLLQSPELQNTPLGQAFQLQQAVFGDALAGLTGGESFAGKLPGDLAFSIGDQLASASGARGTSGSPAEAIQAALRFSGASEGIRQNRINSALNVLQSIGGGSIFPNASQFLQVGAQKASQGAGILFNAGLQGAQAQAAENAQIGQLIGTVLSGVAGGGLGALGGFEGLTATSTLGKFGQGFAAGSGLLPTSAVTAQPNFDLSQLFGGNQQQQNFLQLLGYNNLLGPGSTFASFFGTGQ